MTKQRKEKIYIGIICTVVFIFGFIGGVVLYKSTSMTWAHLLALIIGSLLWAVLLLFANYFLTLDDNLTPNHDDN